MYYILLRFKKYYRQCIKDPKGFSIMAGYIMGLLSQTLNNGFEKIGNQIDKYTEKFKHYRSKQIELENHEILNDNDYPKLLSRYKVYLILLIILILCEGFLNYLTTLIVIPVEEDAIESIKLFLEIARVVLSLAATIAGIIAVDWVLEQILPKRKLQIFKIRNNEKVKIESNKEFSLTNLLLGILMLGGIEFAIYQFGLKRAQDFEGTGSAGKASTEALIVLSMIVPIIAGVIWWDIQQYRYALINRKKIEKLKIKISEIINAKNKSMRRLETFFKIETQAFHNTYTRFNIRKRAWNLQNNKEDEDLKNHFAIDYESFVKEAKERTNNIFTEVESKSKLFDETINDPGNKLNQKMLETDEINKDY